MLSSGAFVGVPGSPFRPPSWRFLRCRDLIERGEPPRPDMDDPTTRDAWAYLRELGRCGGAERPGLTRRFPALAEAHTFFCDAPPLARAEVEARLLGGQDDGTIAARCGLSPPAVAAFHDLYLDVRPHLQDEGYILFTVLPDAWRGDGTLADDRGLLLKLFGYAMGGLTVDRLLAYFAAPPVVPGSLAGLGLKGLKALRDQLRTRILVLMHTTPAGAASPAVWHSIRERFAEACRDGQGGGAAGAVLVPIRTELPALEAPGGADAGRPVVSPRKAEVEDVLVGAPAVAA